MSGDWAAAVVVASIAMGFTIYHTATAWFTHKERLAKIEKGIDPDKAA